MVSSLVIFLLASAAYLPYARTPRGPHGGSWIGLAYGIAGSALILFAFLLSLRRRFRTARFGTAFTWMQGHVWLGLLSYPLILCHAGFAWGGTLTSVLMWIFTAVIVSGIAGLILQQYIPRTILHNVPAVTIFEQIPHVIEELKEEVVTILETVRERVTQREPVLAGSAGGAGGLNSGGMADIALLQRFIEDELMSFLADPRTPRNGRLATAAKTEETFFRIGTQMGPEMQSKLKQLREIIEERRQFDQQRRLHYWLHLWLLAHVPLSYALVILAALHAVQAWRFASIGG